MKRFVSCCAGSTAIEYALIASLIAIFIVTALAAFGDARNGMFQEIQNAIISVVAPE